MLVRAYVEYGYVDPGRLLDDRHQVAQRLHAQVMCPAEPSSGGAPFLFGVHSPLPLRQTVVGMAWSSR